jgi:hypothetical protein
MSESVVDLVRRFEPILIFAHLERFFPCDAKRYIENCALWQAEGPFDQKESWGGKGKQFNRKPLIADGKIAASNEPGEIQAGTVYLGTRKGTDFLFLKDNGEQNFLAFGGWKDSATVTKTSENRYANLTFIDNVYKHGDLLRSKFWYHAELFDTARLRRLMVPQEPNLSPDLSSVFKELAPRNPALLCYYFFFPGHDESLPEPCDQQLTGKEYASFAG